MNYIGQSVARLEDRRLLRGEGQFVDDVTLPDMAVMAILRSPHAHARIRSVDLSAARAFPGVIDAFSAGDLDGDLPLIPLRLTPFEGFERFLQAPIAAEKVRFVGEPVAVVVANSRAVAEDALARIEVDYDILPPVLDNDSVASGDVLVHEAAGENYGTRYQVSRGDADSAFAGADYTRREIFTTNRHAPCPMETRGLIGIFDPDKPLLRLIGATKVTYFNRRHLAAAFDLPEEAVELIEVDVGGAFGQRGELYPEDYLVPMAARRVRRPVKWIEDRREHLMAANHSRDIQFDMEIAATNEGMILGMRAIVRGDMGAYMRTNGGVVTARAALYLPGSYRIPNFTCDVEFLMTNKTPVGTYRGPGRFEAGFCRERIIDMMAADLGLDPAETRLKNLLTPDELPYPIGELVPGDRDTIMEKGDFLDGLRRVLDAIDYDQWKDRQGELVDGKLIGLGIACFTESSAAGPPETARVTVDPHGGIEVRIGASTVGQGVETAMAQICGDLLEIPMEGITVLHGSTTLLDSGGGTFASRNTVMAGNALRVAVETLQARCIELAALRWNQATDGLSYGDGGVRNDENGEFLGIVELAAFESSRAESPDSGGLSADGVWNNQGKLAFSSGAHACLLAVDPETGEVELKKYALLEEVGRALNPAMVEGQSVGGLVMGLGGTFLDHLIYDDDGQLLTTNLADYLLPVSTGLPEITSIMREDYPSDSNPMGFKGVGEGGITSVAGAVGNAVAQALKGHGVEITDLPLSPARLYALIDEAGSKI
ncbi:MAG: xanthine dehydrogenase family protein molybdopterin-binding subunit [Rhodospirillaceae bacterium]|jgi:aerobic carbon-monoxide dehydrogenase large subunit|nr:xanthine dehydrogenase family protein molybdopterin-binding subunit [Rhodospirillaceae bacterium]MBT5459733.1 xanthine dehydrogenase family protein molybdopterin-binding subunit [Rhodospirillaceae bacterium]